MRWPFVPKRCYDDLQAKYADARSDLAQGRDREAYLMNVILDMRMSGGTVARVAASSSLRVVPQRSAIQQAIDENPIASSNPRLRRHLATWAEQQRREDVDEAEIVERIRGWHIVSTEADDDDEDDALEPDVVATDSEPPE
jgi:hypothetical protein